MQKFCKQHSIIFAYKYIFPLCFLFLPQCNLMEAAASEAYLELLEVTPTSAELSGIKSVLGEDFPDARYIFYPDLDVYRADINNDGTKDIVVSQSGLCSNHACEFHFLLNFDNKWSLVASIESWAIPYLFLRSSGPNGIVVFDHTTPDCNACSPPRPILYVWSYDSNGSASYREFGEIPNPPSTLVPEWEWMRLEKKGSLKEP